MSKTTMPTAILQTEKSEKKVRGKNGGARPGAGAKKGVTPPAVIAKQAIKRMEIEYVRQRVSAAKDVLINSQLTLARGMNHLYKIEKERIVGPKGGISYRPKRPELVTNQWEIESYLQSLVDEANGEQLENENDRGATYYYMTTTPPDNRAIDSLLDRTLGKAQETVKHEGAIGIVQLIARLEHGDNSNS